MIVDVKESPVHGKRYRAYIMNKRKQIQYFDFGFLGGKTFIDGRTEEERMNYWKRHMGNKTEEKLITNLIASPSVLSAFLLWGKSRDLQKNIKTLNDLWKKKHET